MPIRSPRGRTRPFAPGITKRLIQLFGASVTFEIILSFRLAEVAPITIG